MSTCGTALLKGYKHGGQPDRLVWHRWNHWEETIEKILECWRAWRCSPCQGGPVVHIRPFLLVWQSGGHALRRPKPCVSCCLQCCFTLTPNIFWQLYQIWMIKARKKEKRQNKNKKKDTNVGPMCYPMHTHIHTRACARAHTNTHTRAHARALATPVPASPRSA